MQGAECIAGDLIMHVPRAGHRIDDTADVLMLDGGGQLSGELVLDGNQVESFGCAHVVTLS
jgi:hypothetical protein